MIRKIFTHFKQNFLTGIFVIIPIAVVIWLTRFLLRLIWSVHDSLPRDLQILSAETTHGSYFIELLLFALVAFLFIFLIATLGWGSKLYIGQKGLGLLKHLVEKIPFLGTVYSALDQLFKTLGAGTSSQFHRVVMIEYPRKGIHVLAFVTGKVEGERFPKNHLNNHFKTILKPF